ncbi:hypothetical protein [Streptomyces durhamensis]|uniref:hypothetical protein n=1 Tax=Streptomyces durhamensis TaxID=68194 RepID=UPI0012FF1422|nr:hypothetical protein [Streptomyces durhamensis]
MSFFCKRRTIRLSQRRRTDCPLGPIRISYNAGLTVIALVQGPGMPPVTVVPGRDRGTLSINQQGIPTRRGNDCRWALRWWGDGFLGRKPIYQGLHLPSAQFRGPLAGWKCREGLAVGQQAGKAARTESVRPASKPTPL